MGFDEADFIVVGAGSSGCALAARLSEDPAVRVLLLEAGGSDQHPLIAMPLAWMAASMMPQFGWGTMSEPEPHLDNRVQPLPRGRVLGGCSSINGGMYIRGAAADYDGWRDAGLAGWGYEDVLPYFKRSETNWRGAGPDHGGSGPLSVERMPLHPELFPAFMETAERLGYPLSDDFNVRAPEGFGIPDHTVRGGRRHSAARAYLDPAKRRSNLRVETGVLVRRVVISGGRATGVEIEQAGQRKIVSARREVILCAGTFNSPQLLMLSGIGPAQHIADLGIRPLVDLPGVGANLQDHPMTFTFWKAARDNTFERELRLDRLALNTVKWWATGKGTPSASPLTIQSFIRSNPSIERPDLQFQVSHVSYEGRPWFPMWRKGAGHIISAGVLLLAPKSRGQVLLSSPRPEAPPRIQLNFLADERDRTALRDGVRVMRRFFATEPANQFVSHELAPGRGVSDDESVDTWVRASTMSGAHPTSTCAMGTGDGAVTDATLRVRGVDGLRVADCSVMPRIVRGNTNAPAIMIAEKAADLLRAM